MTTALANLFWAIFLYGTSWKYSLLMPQFKNLVGLSEHAVVLRIGQEKFEYFGLFHKAE